MSCDVVVEYAWWMSMCLLRRKAHASHLRVCALNAKLIPGQRCRQCYSRPGDARLDQLRCRQKLKIKMRMYGSNYEPGRL